MIYYFLAFFLLSLVDLSMYFGFLDPELVLGYFSGVLVVLLLLGQTGRLGLRIDALMYTSL